MSIGANIKMRREAANMTQEQLAEKVGVQRPMITQVERGSRVPTMILGDLIAQALHCTVDDLLHGEHSEA